MKLRTLTLMLALLAVPVATAEDEVPCDEDGCDTDDDRGCDGVVAVGCTYDYHANCQYQGPTDRVYCDRYTQGCYLSIMGVCQVREGSPQEVHLGGHVGTDRLL